MTPDPNIAASIAGQGRLRRSLTGAFVLLVVIALAYAPPQAKAADTPAHLAVWQVVNKKRTFTGTAFAIQERHFREAEAGDVLAQVELGDRYRKREDWERAFGWYRRAAEQGNAFAMYRLAFLYYHGKGVPKNDRRAFEWMHQSAREGEPGAQYNLGVFFLWGVGTPVERALGLRWLERAAGSGDHDARKLLDETM